LAVRPRGDQVRKVERLVRPARGFYACEFTAVRLLGGPLPKVAPAHARSRASSTLGADCRQKSDLDGTGQLRRERGSYDGLTATPKVIRGDTGHYA
jgi:hypothetical protein